MTYVVFFVVDPCLLFRMESLFQEIDQSGYSIYDQVWGNGSVVLRNGVYFASDRLHSVPQCISQRFKNCCGENFSKRER